MTKYSSNPIVRILMFEREYSYEDAINALSCTRIRIEFGEDIRTVMFEELGLGIEYFEDVLYTKGA